MGEFKDSDALGVGESDLADSAEAILNELQRILQSPEFEGTERVQAFLNYIVRETVAGRGNRIRGKTILEDVYERSAQNGRDPLALVRVDAGRLRRYLSAYYADSGADAKIRIKVEPGGYEPQFSQLHMPASLDASTPTKGRTIQLTGAASVVVMGAIAFWSYDRGSDRLSDKSGSVRAEVSSPTEKAVREALLSASPARLQAANLATKARSSLFPALEPQWQELVLGMFGHIVDLDPNYFAGYAGAAQAEAMVSMTMPPSEQRARRLQSAEDSARRAVELGVDEGWSHSAAATVAFSQRDFDLAFKHSARAVALAPDDANVLTFDAIIALFGGEFERARTTAEQVGALKKPTDDFPDLSVAASASFHLGDYETARDLIMQAAVAGDPISPISLGYIIAIHERLEKHTEASEMVNLLETAWPTYPVDLWFLSIYRNSNDANAVIQAMVDAGWSRP